MVTSTAIRVRVGCVAQPSSVARLHVQHLGSGTGSPPEVRAGAATLAFWHQLPLLVVMHHAPLASLPRTDRQLQPAAQAPQRRRCREAHPTNHLPHAPPAVCHSVNLAKDVRCVGRIQGNQAQRAKMQLLYRRGECEPDHGARGCARRRSTGDCMPLLWPLLTG